MAIKDELTLINEIGLLFSDTIKFRNIHSQNSNEKIRPFCPTRWTIRKYVIFKVLNNYKDTTKLLRTIFDNYNDIEEFDIFSIIERVVTCYINVNTTLENTYKITKICLAELKSQRDDFGDKPGHRTTCNEEKKENALKVYNEFINYIFIILYLDMKLQEMHIFQKV